MRRAMTRPRGLDVVRDFIGWRRRIVGADDGRVIIIKTEMDAGRVPFPLHGLGVPVAILFSRRVALWTGLEGDLRWTLPARREHASQIAACFLHGPLRNRLALDAVGPQQFRTAPPLDDGFELPRQIDGVGDAGIHAEAPGRRHQVTGVAGQKYAVGTISFSHQFASYPGHDRFDLKVEGLAHGAND